MLLTKLLNTRSNLENPATNLFDVAAWNDVFDNRGTLGLSINEASALSIPAAAQANSFISSKVAELPLKVHKKSDKAATDHPLAKLLSKPNSAHTKTDFWSYTTSRLVVEGRALALIVRNRAQQPVKLIPIDPREVTITQSVKNSDLVRTYEYKGSKYDSADVLDFCKTLRPDTVSHYSPLRQHRETFAAIIAVERYASILFSEGGTPPLALTMPAASSVKAQQKGANEIASILSSARDKVRKIVPLPDGFELKPIGIDAAKSQMIELRQFQISEVSRIFNLAPALMHDLSNGTYSNFQQQSQSFAQITLAPLISIFEAELNAKLFGDDLYAQFDLRGLLRGDNESRMNAFRTAISSGIMTVNEARAKEDLPPIEGGDKALVQGGMAPLDRVSEGGFLDKGKAEAPDE